MVNKQFVSHNIKCTFPLAKFYPSLIEEEASKIFEIMNVITISIATCFSLLLTQLPKQPILQICFINILRDFHYVYCNMFFQSTLNKIITNTITRRI